MKTLIKSLIVLCLMLGSLSTGMLIAGNDKGDVYRFIREFTGRLERENITVSEQQREALKVVYPLILAAYHDDLIQDAFWTYVVEEDPKRITWGKTIDLIMSGKIKYVSSAHSGRIELHSYHNERYVTYDETAEQPLINILEEVDPKNVFIGHEME